MINGPEEGTEGSMVVIDRVQPSGITVNSKGNYILIQWNNQTVG